MRLTHLLLRRPSSCQQVPLLFLPSPTLTFFYALNQHGDRAGGVTQWLAHPCQQLYPVTPVPATTQQPLLSIQHTAP